MIVLALIIAIVISLPSHTNPPVVSEPNWDLARTRDLAQRACYDCHSNETVWPWYSYLPPVSWQIVASVQAGRRTLNFSDWANVSGEAWSGGELAETIGEGQMPPRNYLSMHPAANLTSAERQELIDGLLATIRGSRSGEVSGGDDEGDD